MDEKLTEQIRRWLDLPEKKTDAQIIEGATLLLRLNRNKILYNNIIVRPQRHASKVTYELKKFYRMRIDGMTSEKVKELDASLTPVIKEAVEAEPKDENGNVVNVEDLPAHRGKRSDHDSLPEDIKAIWPANAERWKKIKQLYNTLLNIEMPCDRYEYLKQELDLWHDYKNGFAKYDSYKVGEENGDEEAAGEHVAPNAKDVTNARSYISKNLEKLQKEKIAAEAETAGEKEKADYASDLSKVQERVMLLLNSNETIGDDLRAKLIDAGVNFPETVGDEQGQED